jgi:hypothetical protein
MNLEIPTGSVGAGAGDNDSTAAASSQHDAHERQRQETNDVVADMSSGLSGTKNTNDVDVEQQVNNTTTKSDHGRHHHRTPSSENADISAPWVTDKPENLMASPPSGRGHHRNTSMDSLKNLSKSERAKRIGKIYKKNAGGDIMLASSHRHVAGTSPLAPGSIKEAEVEEEATWGDVCRAMCNHSGKEWAKIGGFILMLLTVLYFFLFGLDLLGTSFAVVGGCTAGSMLGSDTNPLASVMIGIVATAILQSSSTTTSIVVSLVSGGLDVKQAIYM